MRYFKVEEFLRCSPSCSVEQMDMDFMRLLDSCREFAGIPFYLLSAYRSPEHDRKRGRSGRGYHTLGRAVDISVSDGSGRWKVLQAATQLGLSIGIYPTFLHIDNRPNPIVFYGK